jgi:NADH-quinone oxidoreductase subunit C
MSDEIKPEVGADGKPSTEEKSTASTDKEEFRENGPKVDGAEKDQTPADSVGSVPAMVGDTTGKAVDSAAAVAPITAAATTAAKSAEATGSVTPAVEEQGPSDAEKEAKAKAAAEARAARASARATKPAEEGADAAPKEPSPNQPMLDRLVQLIKEAVGEEAVEQAFINETDADLPVVIIKNDLWAQTALLFKEHDELKCNYLRNVSGVDQETHLEVVYHLLSLSSKKDYCVKVKTDREQPSIPSVTPIWPTANWNEREVYDLYGIHFSGHPDLRRIMMPDDWVGHPLRKDYEPLDPEV